MTIHHIDIGDPVTTPDGNEYRVYLEHWANEAPDCLTLDGPACLVFLDPGTKTGRKAITDLIAHLQLALIRHDAAVDDIYTNLKVGGHPSCIRVASEKETRCGRSLAGDQCVRVEHVDSYHVTIDDTVDRYAVRSVWRA